MSQLLHVGVVIDPLVRQQSLNFSLIYLSVGPVQIPIQTIICIQSEIQLATGFLDNAVLGLGSAKDYLRQRLLRRGRNALVLQFLRRFGLCVKNL
jgi:hypothetical protein